MQSSEILSLLRKSLPAEYSSQIISALRWDPIIWKSLQDPVFVQKLALESTGKVQDWTPAELGLSALGARYSALDLVKNPRQPLEGSFQRQATEIYDRCIRMGSSKDDLHIAMILALALRENHRKSNGWLFLAKDLTTVLSGADISQIAIWRSALVCLVGIIEEPVALLETTLDLQPHQPALVTTLHILLANPLTSAEAASRLGEVLIQHPAETQLEAIRELRAKGAISVATELSRLLVSIQKTGTGTLQERTGAEDDNPQALSRHALELVQKAVIYQQAGQSAHASEMISLAQRDLKTWMASLEIMQADIEMEQGREVTARKHAKEAYLLADQSPRIQNEIFSLSILGDDWKAANGGDEMLTHPFARLSRALYSSEPLSQKKPIIEAEIHAVMNQVDHEGGYAFPRLLHNLKIGDTLRKIALSGFPVEARDLGKLFLQARPNDCDMMYAVREVSETLGDLNTAEEMTQMAILYDPANVATRRKLADILERNCNWEQALEERKLILSSTENENLNDLLAAGRTALYAHDCEEAIQFSQQALQKELENGQALALLGRAKYELGEYDEAAVILTRATMTDSDRVEAWIWLAQAYQAAGKTAKELETLRAAVLAVPESAEINFELASACLENGYQAEALPYLRRASQLSPESQEVSLQLAGLLQSLGHAEEALRVIEPARIKWPKNIQMAHIHGELLLEKRDRDGAIQAFETAVCGEEAPSAWYLEYAQALMNDSNDSMISAIGKSEEVHLINAQHALEKISEDQPEYYPAQLLLADALRLLGYEQDALDIYQTLSERLSFDSSIPAWRLQAGIGKTAMLLNQPETALAALQAAVHDRPERLDLQQWLSEAFLQAGLYHEASRQAEQALHMAPDQLNNMLWYASQMEAMGEDEAAAETLRTAVEFDPGRAEHYLRLARLEIRMDDRVRAGRSLASVQKMNSATTGDLQETAFLYLELGDLDQAIICLNRVIQIGRVEPSMLLTAACLYLKRGDLDQALELLQKTVERDSQQAFLYVFEADLLHAMQRYQASFACLEHAARLQENIGNQSVEGYVDLMNTPGLLPVAWLEVMENPGILQSYFVQYYFEGNDLGSALEHACQFLDRNPEDRVMRYIASSIAYLNLESDKALRMLSEIRELSVDENMLGSNSQTLGTEPIWEGMNHLYLQLALESDHLELAGEIAEKWLAGHIKPSPIYFGISRWFNRMNNLQSAWQTYETIRSVDPDEAEEEILEPVQSPRVILLNVISRQENLWRALAELDLFQWDAAEASMGQWAESRSDAARTRFELAKLIIRKAEWKTAFDALSAERHAPDPKCMGRERWDAAMQLLSTLPALADISRWKIRANAIFDPQNDLIRELAGARATTEDASALLILLRRCGKTELTEKAAEGYPSSPMLLIQKAINLLDVDAQKVIELLEGGERNPLLLAIGSIAYEKLEEKGMAIQTLEDALDLWMDEPEWQSRVASLYEELGDISCAAEHRRIAVDLEPSSVEDLLALGRAYLGLDRAQDAIKTLERCWELDPNSDVIAYQLALANRKAGQTVDAMRYADFAARVKTAGADALLLSGEIAREMGKLQTALEYGKKAIEREPMNPRVILFLAHCLEEKQARPDALMVLQKSIQTGIKDAEIQFETVRILKQSGQAQAGLQMLREMLKEDANDARTLSELARTLFDMDQPQEAERMAYQSVRVAPGQADMHLLLGRIQMKNGHLDQAIQHLSEAVRLAPDDVDSYIELGKVYQDRREHTKALWILKQALAIAPNDSRAYFQAGIVLRENKDYAAAESMLRKASDLAPDDLNIRRLLGAVIALNLVYNSQEVNSAL